MVAALNAESPDLPTRRTAASSRIGIAGGGQLGRMNAIAAAQLGFDTIILERKAECPAAAVALRSLVGDWDSEEGLRELAALVDVVTLENEFVDTRHLAALEADGHLVFPSARTIGLVQDKFIQKQTLLEAGLPVPAMRAVENVNDVAAAGEALGFPLLLKARRNGYDGKGNATVRSVEDIGAAWERLGGNAGNALYVEEFCAFTAELAIIITRGRDRESVAYPVVETVQRNHVCHLVRAPAAVDAETEARAAEIGRRAVEAVDAVGSFGVEMFLKQDGEIVVNELAPRVHNSGHYTIEACECSQFENHVRAVLGLPLGSTRLVAPAAVMVNLLGTAEGPGRALGLERALAVSGAHVHLYGKTQTGEGRKMGHVTALGDSLEEAEHAATRCAGEIRFGDLS